MSVTEWSGDWRIDFATVRKVTYLAGGGEAPGQARVKSANCWIFWFELRPLKILD